MENEPIIDNKKPEQIPELEQQPEPGQMPELEQEPEQEQQIPFEFGNITKPVMFGTVGIVLILLAVFARVRNHRKMGKPLTKEPTVENHEEKEMSQMLEETKKPEKGIYVSAVHEQGARKEQQDSFRVTGVSNKELLEEKGVLAVVADGMGGLTDGGQVSALVADTCLNTFHILSAYVSSADMLLEMAMRSNVQVNHYLQDGQKSGSTLVAAIVRNGYLNFLTIGDSRIYLYRGGTLLQLNREHIYKEELALMAVNGMVPAMRIYNDPQTNSLTSYLGNGQISHLDRNLEGFKLIDKDRILLASDGVFGTLIPEQLEWTLSLPIEEAAKKIQELITIAGKTYQDNYTALILEYRD